MNSKQNSTGIDETDGYIPKPVHVNTYSVVIPISPVAQGRGSINAKGKFPRIYDPKKSREFKNKIKEYLLDSGIPTYQKHLPVTLSVECYVKRPLAHYTKNGAKTKLWKQFPTAKPDVSNYAKGIEDALIGIVLHDDAQIVDLIAKKRYATIGTLPYLVISVYLNLNVEA